ncbi:sulfatase-like hydrolase/transferase [Microbacterium marmarense]|uniref:Sulfatase-like hydrolase/transferase n=1 Tax=Microbacterium marmarense TaxID=3122051 RepID=A0ABU8LS21_9MICO
MSVRTPPRHAIVIMTDQHARYASGAYSNPTILTPNIDALASRGTTYSAAYCNSPICVPSRASIMTGRPVHEIGAWDNAHPYSGSPEGWSHALRQAGVHTAVIGKMHFRSGTDDTGFNEVIEPLDVIGGVGDIYSLVREGMPPRPALADLVRDARVGESPYLDFDRRVADAATDWIANAPLDESWVLLVSFATPHHPLRVPQKYWDLYPDIEVEDTTAAPDTQHPYIAELRRVMGVGEAFEPDEISRARRAYYGLCTLADELVGQVLTAASDRGFDDETTTTIYTSDHGVSLGERGLWWKHHMYEESAGVPLIASGPRFAPGSRVAQPVSLTSLYPTLLDVFGVEDSRQSPLAGPTLPASDDSVPHTAGGFSEYHALGASSAAFLLRREQFKLVYFATEVAQLFDLEQDPGEHVDLVGDPRYAEKLAEMVAELMSLVDVHGVDQRAREDQARLIMAHGGRDAILADGFTIAFTPPPEAVTP